MKKEPNYIVMFVISLLITLLIHYFLISKFNFYPTMHVFIGLLIFWVILALIASLNPKRK